MSALDVVVIGAGQAGLSTAHHVVEAGLRPHEDVVVLDVNPGPGDPWCHRWPSLTFGTAHGIHVLPGLSLGTPETLEPISSVVTRYYGEYEARFSPPVIGPARVSAVAPESNADGAALLVRADGGTSRTLRRRRRPPPRNCVASRDFAREAIRIQPMVEKRSACSVGPVTRI